MCLRRYLERAPHGKESMSREGEGQWDSDREGNRRRKEADKRQVWTDRRISIDGSVDFYKLLPSGRALGRAGRPAHVKRCPKKTHVQNPFEN